ncbi:hypothetical protein [Helicobacter pylori]|nr:hypothetical protein [Helicobacter pylori]
MLSIQLLQNRLASFSEHSSGFATIVCVSKIKQDSANLARSAKNL